MIAVITHANIHAAGLTGPDAAAVYALGAGIVAGSLAVGAAMTERRWGAFSLILLALLAGEGFNLYQTAARQVLTHEEAMAEYTQRRTDLEALEKSLAAAQAKAPETARLIAAREQLARTQAAIEAEKRTGCRTECKRLKHEVLPANEAEIAAALAAAMQTKADGIASLEAQIKAAPLPPQTLGDKAGIGQWVFDLLAAALKSLALNGLACGLVAYGGHTLLAARSGSRGTRQANCESPRARIEVVDVSAADATLLQASNDRALAGFRRSLTERSPHVTKADSAQTDFPNLPEIPDSSNVIALFTGPQPDPNGWPNGSGGPKGGRTVRRNDRKDAVLADIAARHERGERFDSQEHLRSVLAERFGPIAKSTLSEWLGELDGLPRQMHGRCKAVG